jgi:hypothetical protein
MVLLPALALLCACRAAGQTADEAAQSAAGASQVIDPQPIEAQAQQSLPEAPEPRPAMAEDPLKQEENPRVFGVIPNFNSTNDPNAPPLTPNQKIDIAFRSAIDPFAFVAAGIDAGHSQLENNFSGYGQGAQGYAKRYAAAYVDSFNGTMIGNAFLPIVFHEDPRYFRKGTGTVMRRFFYAVSTSLWCRRDNASWGPNYANVLGSLAAGGLSNLYYPSTDRGAALTIERAFTDMAEGAGGAVLIEFWPDISRRMHKKKNKTGTAEPASN